MNIYVDDIEDKRNKYDILHKMFLELSDESLLDIYEILSGYKERVNKTKKDTLLARCMFASGYHNTKEVQKTLNVTKDSAEIKALSNNVFNIKTLDKLRHTFDIDNDTFVKIVKEIGSDKK